MSDSKNEFRVFVENLTPSFDVAILTDEQAISVGINPSIYRGKDGKDGYSPIPGDNGNWWLYDHATGEYIDSGKQAVAISRYSDLEDLPAINDVVLVGNKTSEELGIEAISNQDILDIISR